MYDVIEFLHATLRCWWIVG